MTTLSSEDLRNQVAAGCASFSLADVRDDERAIRTLRAARDAGIRIFDTARAYATVGDPLHNERLLRRALGDDDEIVVMTKGGHFRAGHREWKVDNSPERLRRDVDDSLTALGAECLDLFFVHRADGAIDIEESFGALDELRRRGKVRALGISNATSEQIERACAVTEVAAVENRLVAGSPDDGSLATAARHGVAFFAYSPLGGPAAARTLPVRFPRLTRIAQSRGISPHRLALRGLLAQSPAVSVVVGAGSPERAQDAAAAPREEWDSTTQDAWNGDIADDDHERVSKGLR